jgi:hypothetical protein
MTARHPQERRLDRRIPIDCPVVLRPQGGPPVMGQCVALSVSGMTLVAGYVPGAAEVLEVELLPPRDSAGMASMRARVGVRRCHRVGAGRYEIGVETLEVLA